MDDTQGLRPMGTRITEPLDDSDQAVTLAVTAHLPLRALVGQGWIVGRVQGDRAEILTVQAVGPAHPSWPPALETKCAADPVDPPPAPLRPARPARKETR